MRFAFYIAAFLFLVSCSFSDNIRMVSCSFPENDVLIENRVGTATSKRYISDSLSTINEHENNLLLRLDQLMADSVKTQADLNRTISGWGEIKNYVEKLRPSGFLPSDKKLAGKWFLMNLELLKMTGATKYADEMEKLLYMPDPGFFPDEEGLKRAIYTKMNDQVYVNLFWNSSAHYGHTTGGAVRIMQETNYPEGNRVSIRFETTDKRFVELYVRIPSEVPQASVEVGGVKYKAVPGEYCRVAKKWKTGDVVEISL
ncbi:MAG: glycoside hydrolase family 127 protein [Prolixibacteraceae bacterium]|nr:glycoside hydrolase family 127 protein [Prolixibacteraceae bacterium]